MGRLSRRYVLARLGEAAGLCVAAAFGALLLFTHPQPAWFKSYLEASVPESLGEALLCDILRRRWR